jgi:hypothetical protein
MRRLVASIIYLDFAIVFKLSGITDNEKILPNVIKTGRGSLFYKIAFTGRPSRKISKKTRGRLCLRRARFVLLRPFQLTSKGLKHRYAMTPFHKA